MVEAASLLLSPSDGRARGLVALLVGGDGLSFLLQRRRARKTCSWALSFFFSLRPFGGERGDSFPLLFPRGGRRRAHLSSLSPACGFEGGVCGDSPFPLRRLEVGRPFLSSFGGDGARRLSSSGAFFFFFFLGLCEFRRAAALFIAVGDSWRLS